VGISITRYLICVRPNIVTLCGVV